MPKNKAYLEKEIRETLNKHSAENNSNTPDFILAQYLLNCLEAFDKAVNERERWYGRGIKENTNTKLPDLVEYENKGK